LEKIRWVGETNSSKDANQYFFIHDDQFVMLSCEPRNSFVLWGIEVFDDRGRIIGHHFEIARSLPYDFNTMLPSLFDLLVKHKLIGLLDSNEELAS